MLTNRYYQLQDAIDDLNNAIAMNKILQEQATGVDKMRLMQQEIELYKKQKKAVEDLTAEQRKSADELKKYLSGQGVKFDGSGNVQNYNEILKSRVNWANSLSGDDKEKAIEHVKNLEKALKDYTDLTSKTIPESEKKWQELNKAIQDVYKSQLEMVKNQEKEIFDVIKYHAEKRAKEKIDAIKKEMDAEKERLNKIKENIKAEQDLYNKSNKEDDYEANLNSERKKLAEIQAEIDKLQYATDAKSKALLDKLLREYEEQQNKISETIRDKQREEINDRFEKEQDLVDKELESAEDRFNEIIDRIQKDLEDFLNPANINDMIQSGLVNGFITIGDEVMNIEDAMKDMFKTTTIGMTNTISNISEWLTSLKQVKDIYGSISGIVNGSGLDLSAINGANGINITTGGITIQGNADATTVAQLEETMQSWAKEVYANVRQQLGSR